jgi:hypothetical protein
MSEWVDPRDRFTLQAEKEFRGSVRPIYRNSEKEPLPEHIASCLLLEVDGAQVVCTAAHVADHQKGYTLWVGGSRGKPLVPILGRFITTATPAGGRRFDRLDCAFWKAPAGAVSRLGDVMFLGEEKLSHKPPALGRLYTAFGYPCSRNKKAIDHSTKEITTRISMYTADVAQMPRLAAKLGVSGVEHLFLSFEKKAFVGHGKRTNTFGPNGLSGGALPDLGGFASEGSFAREVAGNALLGGMVIEYHREHRALVAVKIGTIVNGIRLALYRERPSVREPLNWPEAGEPPCAGVIHGQNYGSGDRPINPGFKSQPVGNGTTET